MRAPREPLISVGLPVFDGERYLREAVDSVLAQDLEDFELILCDNASTDGTAALCAEYVARDPRVRYAGSDENRGAAWNYNRAVGLARGRFFRWMTHDDRLLPGCLRRCHEAFAEGPPDLVLAYPRTRIIDAQGRVVGEYEDRAECLAARPHERVRKLLRNLSLCNAVLGLVPLEVLRTTRLIGSWAASDKTLLIELALRGRIRELPEPLFERRRDPSLPSPSNLPPAERARWFDARARSRAAYRTTLVRETFRAVERAPLEGAERVRCRVTVLRDALRHRRELLGELRSGLFGRQPRERAPAGSTAPQAD